MASPETKNVKPWSCHCGVLGDTKVKEVWQWCFCSSPETNTFHHITSAFKSAPLIHQGCQMFAHSTISFSWLIQNADDFLLHRSPARFFFFFTAFCAFFFFFLHKGPSSYTAAYNEMFTTVMVQWHCHVVSRYSSSLHREYVAMRALTPRWYCGTIREKGALVCVCVCVFKSWHSPPLFQGHLHWYTFGVLTRPSLLE